MNISRAIKIGKETKLDDHVLMKAKFELFDRAVRLVFKYDANRGCDEVDKTFTTFEAISAQYVADIMRLSPEAASYLPQFVRESALSTTTIRKQT